MNRIFQPCSHVMLFRLSDNAERYKSKGHLFKVRHGKNASRIFSSLLEAFIFYITLEEEADLYDVSNGSILIERKIQLFLN